MRLLYIRYEILHLPRWPIFLTHLIQLCRISLDYSEGKAMAKIDPKDGSETEEDEGGVT